MTASAGGHWMTLLIDIDQNTTTGWHGFDYVVNRVAPGPNTAQLERSINGSMWESVAEIPYRVVENELHLAIERSALGLPEGKISVDFKWADNVPVPGDIMDFYGKGDVAPEGRLMFRYQAEYARCEQFVRRTSTSVVPAVANKSSYHRQSRWITLDLGRRNQIDEPRIQMAGSHGLFHVE